MSLPLRCACVAPVAAQWAPTVLAGPAAAHATWFRALPPPLAGRWMLRGVDLRVSPRTTDEWVSRFVMLAFDVAPRVP